jgi:predicted amidophosphoribosyltransferase
MLHPCPECKAEISDSAELCPRCGYRLVGRESLVRCAKCRADVIPVRHLRDTISLYCPFCHEPITNLKARKVFIAFVIAFMIAVAAVVLFVILRVSSRSVFPT